jgi:hypothetical protein
MFFCSEERTKITKENPDLGNKQIITELGARWKTLKESNPSEVERYEVLAREDKERYLKEKGSESNSEEVAQKSKKEKKTKAVVVEESSEKKPIEDKPKDVDKSKKEKKPKEDKAKEVENPKDAEKSKKEKKPKKN